MKNFLKLYTKLIVIILTLILFLPITKLIAHNVTESPWLFINDIPFTEVTENPIPNPSKLSWGEHIFSQDLNVGDKAKITIDRDVISRDLEVEKDNISTEYKLFDSNNKSETFNDDFTKSFETTGNYFLNIKLSRKDNQIEIITESAMIIVGNIAEPSKFKVNDEEIDITSAAPTYTIKDTYDLKFEVTNQDTTKFNYVWDLGTGETKDGSSIQYSFDKAKIPVYVILRTTDKSTNVFADSYVRVDSDKQTEFGIPRPPVKIPPAESNNNSLDIFVSFIGFAIIILIIVYFLINRKKK